MRCQKAAFWCTAVVVLSAPAVWAQDTDTATVQSLRPLPLIPRVVLADSSSVRRTTAVWQAAAAQRKRLAPRLWTGGIVGGVLGFYVGGSINDDVSAGPAEPDMSLPIGLVGAAIGTAVGLAVWWMGW